MRSLLSFFALTVFTIFFTGPVSAISDEELVSWLHGQGLTKYNSSTEFRPTSHIARGEAAKFMVAFATLMDKPKVKSLSECQFSDISDYDSTLTEYIIASCEYGIFKGFNGKFFPKNSITKAEAIAVVIRMSYGMMDETEIGSNGATLDGIPMKSRYWYEEYYEKGNDLGFTYDDDRVFLETKATTRIQVAHRIYQLYQHKINTALDAWHGREHIYDLDAAKKVLEGKGLPCDAVSRNHNYECNDPTEYPTIKSFLYNLETDKYQVAADLMNVNSMIPRIISSINNPVYFIPFHKGILGFFVSGNGDALYNMLYITIANDKLYLYRSKQGMYIGNGHSFNWHDPRNNQYTTTPFPGAYYPKGIESCNYESDCIKKHIKSVMLGTSDDTETASRVAAMKQKILKAQKN